MVIALAKEPPLLPSPCAQSLIDTKDPTYQRSFDTPFNVQLTRRKKHSRGNIIYVVTLAAQLLHILYRSVLSRFGQSVNSIIDVF